MSPPRLRLRPSQPAAWQKSLEDRAAVGDVIAIFRLPSVEAAIEDCKRYAEILGGTLEIDVRALYEPEDLP